MLQNLLHLSTFLLPAAALSPMLAPFWEPEPKLGQFSSLGNVSFPQSKKDLDERDGNCPANYNSCLDLGVAEAGACCTSGSVCTRDYARNIACCPKGAQCTGTLALSAATTTGGPILGMTTSTPTAPQVITATATSGYVPNNFFPFPYIPMTYPDSSACMSAYGACQSNYAACTAELQGSSGFGVTIVAPAGGVTVSPTAQNLGAPSASSICSSLSSQACYNIDSTSCLSFGTAFVVATATNSATRPMTGYLATTGMVVALAMSLADYIL